MSSVLWVPALVLLFAAGGARAAPRNPADVRRVFDEVHAQLDAGGELMVIAHVEGLLESALNSGLALLEAAPEEAEEARAGLGRLAGFLERQGFYSVQGIGYSAVPRDDGLHDIKLFIARPPEAAGMPLWRMLVGGEPSAMACHAYVPGDAVLVHSGSGDPAALWRMIRQGVAEVGGPGAADAFEAGLKEAAVPMGVTADELIASLAAEGVIALQLSTDSQAALPGPSGEITLPEPSLLLVLAVREPTVMDALKRVFAREFPEPLPEERVGDAVIYKLPLPIPAPFPVQPTLATQGEYLIFGTTTKAVADALDAAAKGNGLVAGAEFQAAFPDLGANNGIRFVSKRLGQALASVRDQVLAQQDDDGLQEMKPALDLLKTWLDSSLGGTVSAAVYHRPSGVLVAGSGPAGGRQALGALATAPLGVMAAIAIPSFVRARDAARDNACINHLRILDAAKEQLAMEDNLAPGERVSEGELLKFLRGGVLPACPQGGDYSLNPVGTDPSCSHPGHSLHGGE